MSSSRLDGEQVNCPERDGLAGVGYIPGDIS